MIDSKIQDSDIPLQIIYTCGIKFDDFSVIISQSQSQDKKIYRVVKKVDQVCRLYHQPTQQCFSIKAVVVVENHSGGP